MSRSDESRDACREYVLLMLGAPAIEVDLDPEELDGIIDNIKASSLQDLKEKALKIARKKLGE
jgi:hypothetical protein